MTSVRGRGRPRYERSSAAPSIALLDSSPPPKLGDELSDQPAGPLETKPSVINSPFAATSIPKYSKNDLQQILNAVLEVQAPAPAPASVLAPAPTPAPAPIVAKAPRKKLKACSPDVYCGKSHMDCYNFCQQCVDYFATAGVMGPTQIPFAMSFLWDRISFRWQQYKRKRDTDSSVPVMWDGFKAFLCHSLGNSQAFMETYLGKLKSDSQHQQEETGQPIWSTCKRSSKSLILLQLQIRRPWSDAFWKAWNLLSGPSWMPKAGTWTSEKRSCRMPSM